MTVLQPGIEFPIIPEDFIPIEAACFESRKREGDKNNTKELDCENGAAPAVPNNRRHLGQIHDQIAQF